MPSKPKQARRLTDTQGAADYLGLSVHTVRKDRLGARRFPYIKLGPELYRYDLDRLDEVLTKSEVGAPAPALRGRAARAAA
jgi:hypothetical protein